ncbi:MAG: hypothetical protein H0T89_17800 [Deltaproteobacteria bacterium]|nr:hypothetical protein [Deltaproteobacteria bacterium]MDQ3301506.1 hypothetical protein [Myxococcota bacterium]
MTQLLPRYYAVNDRPVKIVPLPDGSSDCLVFDFATGGFVVDRDYFTHVTPGSGKDVDALDEAQFARIVAQRRDDAFQRRREAPIEWQIGTGPTPSYRASWNGRSYTLRLNPPGGPTYTLLVGDQEVETFQAWPPAWKKPGGQAVPRGEIRELADRLQVWATALCQLPPGTPAQALDTLCIAGTPTAAGTDVTVQPPPPGTRKLLVGSRDGDVSELDLVVEPGTLTRAGLDARFGKGFEMPRLGTGAQRVLYRVEAPGAAYKCAVIAGFDQPTTATTVTLRRDRIR